jgi:hypothetical protein
MRRGICRAVSAACKSWRLFVCLPLTCCREIESRVAFLVFLARLLVDAFVSAAGGGGGGHALWGVGGRAFHIFMFGVFLVSSMENAGRT